MAWTFFTDLPDISLGVTGSWQDIDLSAHIPVGSKTVIVKVVNLPGGDYSYGVRKKGSITDHYWWYQIDSDDKVAYAVVACDANRKIQGEIEHLDVDFFLVGYNDQDICPADYYAMFTTAAVWTDTTWNDAGEGAVIELYNDSGDVCEDMSVRKDGSTDDRSAWSNVQGYAHQWGMIGITAAKILERKLHTNTKIYDWGSIGSAEAGFFTNNNGNVHAVTIVGTWEDIALPEVDDGAVGAILEIHNKHGFIPYGVDVRAKGGGQEHYGSLFGIAHRFAFVKLDTNKKFQAKAASTTDIVIYCVGFFKGAGPGPSGPANIAKFSGIAKASIGKIDGIPIANISKVCGV